MAELLKITGRMDDRERRAALFAGAIIHFQNVPSMGRLCELALSMARKAFGGLDPVTAHQEIERSAYLAIVGPLQRAFTNAPEAAALYRDALSEVGVDLEHTFRDWFPLRIQPGGSALLSNNTMGYSAHRDSWYCNILGQNNWWAPVTPLTAGRTLAFFPALFDRPVVNNSDGWDLHAFRQARAAARARGADDAEVRAAYPYVFGRDFDRASEIYILPDPGDIVAFSCAHLHESVPNDTGLARFSTELRTIHIDDLRSGRGAPNVDGRSTGRADEDFYAFRDGRALSAALKESASVPGVM